MNALTNGMTADEIIFFWFVAQNILMIIMLVVIIMIHNKYEGIIKELKKHGIIQEERNKS